MLIPFGILSSAAGVEVGETYELIASEILTTSQASITFSNLGDYSATYKHLQIRAVAKDDFTALAVSDFYLTLNGASSNFKDHFLRGNGSSVTSGSFGYTTVIEQGNMVSSGAGLTNIFGAYVIDILDAFSTTKNTTTRTLTGYNAGSANQIYLSSGAWFNTSAITSINLRSNSNLVAGSRFSLYGIK
jgi:hypothetical protein